MAHTTLRQVALTPNPTATLNPHFHHICRNHAPLADENKPTAEEMSCLRMPVISRVLTSVAVDRPMYWLVALNRGDYCEGHVQSQTWPLVVVSPVVVVLESVVVSAVVLVVVAASPAMAGGHWRAAALLAATKRTNISCRRWTRATLCVDWNLINCFVSMLQKNLADAKRSCWPRPRRAARLAALARSW